MIFNMQNSQQKTRALGYTVAVELTGEELTEIAGGCKTQDTWSAGDRGPYADDCQN